jgi:hypothetical protein
MEPFTVEDVQALRQAAIQSGWVYVSSLAMRTFKKTPLLKRWCEIRAEGEDVCYMEFYRDKDDVEPTKRVSLQFTRVVVSHGRRFTQAQAARIPNASGSIRATAFYIDFPTNLRQCRPNSSPFFETRSMRADTSEVAEDFPLGFIMVAPDARAAEDWERALVNGCNTYVPKEGRRARVQRWINRAWMRIRGDLSIDQFDESFRPSSMDSEFAENFFSIGASGTDRADALKVVMEMQDEDSDNDGSEKSFQTAGESSESEESVERQVMRVSFRLTSRRDSKERESGDKVPTFSSVEDMLKETDDEYRQSVPISPNEIQSAVEYVESTRSLSNMKLEDAKAAGWSLCCTTDTFDCFKSIDEKSGLVRTRTWARIANVPPQSLFHLLYNNDARKDWDHHYARFETIWKDANDPNLDILDAIVSAPIGCANREFLEWRRCMIPDKDREANTGKFVIFLRSWSGPTARPVLKSHVRAEVWLSAYLIQWWRDATTGEPLGSDVMVMSQIDIKGLIPKYLVNALSNSAPKKWVKGVTSAATKEIERKGISKNMTDAELDALYGF